MTEHLDLPDSPESEPVAENPLGSTGARTPEGKAASSLNALKHGCRSEKTILRGEDPAEYEFLVQSWFDLYQPADPLAVTLVQQLAHAHWLLKRNSRRLEQVEFELPSNAYHWTDTHQKLYTNFSRYKTAAERTFLRFVKELDTQQDRKERASERRQRALDRAALLERRWLERDNKEISDNLKSHQSVEITVSEDGQTRTRHIPPNLDLVQELAAQKMPPLVLNRILHFVDGVPPEYDWMRPEEVRKVSEEFAIQRMRYSDWLDVIKKEEATGTGHIGPLGYIYRKPT
jgi:hypothetical protein